MEMDFFDPATIMCEVVMEEGGQDDDAVVTSNEKLELPPIPRFDLQSEQFTYYPTFNEVTPCVSVAPMAPAVLTVPERTIQVTPQAFIKQAEIPQFDFLPTVVFGLHALRKVYESPDETSINMLNVDLEEMQFYTRYFSDTSKVSQFKLHCTTCDKHIGSGSSAINIIKRHRGLVVLVCKNCFDFYGDDKFPTDKEDNTEVFCRWCGQGGKLVCCSFCPKVFCYNCITRNFSPGYLRQIEQVDDWACFFCAWKPLWPLRAICRALIQYLKHNPVAVDNTTCCKKKKLKSPTVTKDSKAVDKPMVVFNPDLKNLCPTPIKKGNSAMVFPNQRAVAPISNFRPPGPQNTSQKVAVVPATKTIPSTEPRPSPSTPANKVQLTRTGKRIPDRVRDVIVNHTDTNYTIVRLSNVGGFEQYIRIVVNGNCLKIPKPAVNPSFPVKSLEHAFQIQKMAMGRLTELHKAQGTSDEDKATTLLSIIDSWKGLIGFVENDLKYNLDIHRNNLKKRTEYAKTNESLMRWEFPSKCKGMFDEDSDIEIIEDDDQNDKQNKLKRKNSEGNESKSASKFARVEEDIIIDNDGDMKDNTNNVLNSAAGSQNIIECYSSDTESNNQTVESKSCESEINGDSIEEDSSMNKKSNDTNKSIEDLEIKNCSQVKENKAMEADSQCNIADKCDKETSECDSLVQDYDVERIKIEGDKNESGKICEDIEVTSSNVINEEHDLMDEEFHSHRSEGESRLEKSNDGEIANGNNVSDRNPGELEVSSYSAIKTMQDTIDKEADSQRKLEEELMEITNECDKNEEKLSTTQENNEIDERMDNAISSSVKEYGQKSDYDTMYPETSECNSFLDESKIVNQLEIEKHIPVVSSNEMDENLLMEIDGASSSAGFSICDSESKGQNNSLIINEQQDDNDIIKLLDGEISRLENETNSANNVNNGSNESSIKFDQALLDEIDSIG